MAFSGAATITSLGARSVRITGLSLAPGASGVIGSDAGSEIQIPSPFPTFNADTCWVFVNDTQTGLGIVNVAKAGSPVRATLTNNNAAATGNLEIIVQAVHSISW